MLKRLAILLAQLSEIVEEPQITYIPSPVDKGMAIVVAWSKGDERRELAQAFTETEMAQATDDALILAVEVLCENVFAEIKVQAGVDLTPEEMAHRLRVAAQQSPQNQATAQLSLLGPANG